MAKVFFSYSHADEALRDRLEKGFAVMRRQGIIESWHDRRIIAGSNLGNEIDAHLEQSDVILLLVSPDFLDSDYCYTKEMAWALELQREGRARVIAIILRPCDWLHTPLKDLLAVPKDGKPIKSWPSEDDAFQDVTNQVRRAIEDIQSKKGTRASIVEQPTTPSTISIPGDGQASFTPAPRSSNLRLKKEFTDFDRDQFLHETFAFMARFFETSLQELEARNPGVQGRFQRIDAARFTAVIYRNGKAEAGCTVRIDSFSGRSHNIAFAYGASASAGTSNEMLFVENDDQAMYFKPMGWNWRGEQQANTLSTDGASEYLWDMLMQQAQ